MDKKKHIELRPLLYTSANPETLDDVLAEIVLQNRHVLKDLFNTSSNKCFQNAVQNMSVEDLYSFEYHHNLFFDGVNGWSQLEPDIIVFYLDTKSQWMIGGHLREMSNSYSAICKPRPVVEVLKEHYLKNYPKEVTETAFSDPKNPRRVISVETEGEQSYYQLESLLLLDDKIIRLPCSA